MSVRLPRSDTFRVAVKRPGRPLPSADAGAAPRRLGPRPGEALDRSTVVPFTWNGRSFEGYAGDTIASALAAAGERVFSRSLKYHRPRGILSASIHDPNCLMQVGGEPNVRGAHRQVEAGMAVSAQNVWPSLRHDVKALNQGLGRFLGPGFYYKTFIHPQRLWPSYEAVLKRFAAGGRVPATVPPGRYDKRYAHADVLVAGGGPAGMAAAISAARAGARVLLVEEEPALGGHLRWSGPAALDTLAALAAEVRATEGIDVLVDSTVAGRYDHNWIAVTQRSHPGVAERLIKARAAALVVSPGLFDRPYVFEGNDLPGVMLASAARRLLNLWAVRPGERAVVVTAGPEGDEAAADLSDAGVEVVRVVDLRRGEDVVRARGAGVARMIDPRGGGEAGRGRGTDGVEAVDLADGSRVDCDLLVMAVGWTAPTSLLNMAGDRPRWAGEAARFVPGDALPRSVLAAGGLAGDGTLDELVAHGRAVGAAAAARAGHGTEGEIPALPLHPYAARFRGRTHGFVDFSEDVASKDLHSAAAEGYDSVELLKRYTTATMGPAQGKFETVNTVAVLAEATGRDIAETGTTVWRPPYSPVSLGALAGRTFEPVRYSPLQAWHEAHGARPLVAGQWIRPDHYGDPDAEVRNVRERVGIIDVTPLGKIDLRGPDVPHLLNLVYVNKWSKLAEGAVRYGVMCAEDGVVFDDGVTGRLGPTRWMMTTTSSGAAAVYEWIEQLLQVEHPDWRIHTTPVTAAWTSINVAGPASRELVSRLAEGVDLTPDAFGYMQVRTATLADVPGCFMWRIGFTGELSYELHVPGAYGLHVWTALLDLGADLGCRPFGVEAQRIMRLEKGHFIVGQDTDGLTKAGAAGLDWLVKPDKADFLGRPELIWEREQPDAQRLVGLQPLDAATVPPEGSQLVTPDGTRSVGRITSARRSPTLRRSIALGFVDTALAGPGTVVHVRLPDGTLAPARVMEHHAHFDPEGSRLRG